MKNHRYYPKDNRVEAYETGEGIVEACRYGFRESGEWHNYAVRELAGWMVGRPGTYLTDGEILEFMEPVGAWDPPSNSTLEISVGPGGHISSRLDLGQWVVRDADGSFSVMNHEEFTTIYEAFDATRV